VSVTQTRYTRGVHGAPHHMAATHDKSDDGENWTDAEAQPAEPQPRSHHDDLSCEVI